VVGWGTENGVWMGEEMGVGGTLLFTSHTSHKP